MKWVSNFRQQFFSNWYIKLFSIFLIYQIAILYTCKPTISENQDSTANLPSQIADSTFGQLKRTYSESKVELSERKKLSKEKKKNLLLVFGADWCGDCKSLNAMLSSPQILPILENDYILQKVDVGRFDRNGETTKLFGDPQEKGIPALVILSPEGNVVISTNNGEFASASSMRQELVEAFLLKYGSR